MLSEDLQKLKRDLETADRDSDRVFYDLVYRSINMLQLATNDVAKALGTGSITVEKWLKGDLCAHFSFRTWIYAYFIKQINLRDKTTTYHVADDYGYKYLFSASNPIDLSKLLLKLAVCSRFLNKMQISYTQRDLKLSFFIDSAKGGDYSAIEELHFLIEELGGVPETRIDNGALATVIPISKKERDQQQPPIKVSSDHCGAVEDGCLFFVEGKCSCTCCLLEREPPKEST